MVTEPPLQNKELCLLLPSKAGNTSRLKWQDTAKRSGLCFIFKVRHQRGPARPWILYGLRTTDGDRETHLSAFKGCFSRICIGSVQTPRRKGGEKENSAWPSTWRVQPADRIVRHSIDEPKNRLDTSECLEILSEAGAKDDSFPHTSHLKPPGLHDDETRSQRALGWGRKQR